MSISNNPLKQYFRRPAIYIKLPSEGKYYSNDTINMTETNEFPVYPMTAIDEITTKTPDALYNGTAVANLIKSCIPDIIDPWKINSIDIDTVLIGIRIASSGSEMELDSACPFCNEPSSYTVDLNHVLSELSCPDYDKSLEVRELKIKFKPLTYKEINEASLGQFELQRLLLQLENISDLEEREAKGRDGIKHITDLTTKILSKTIESIETPNSVVSDEEFITEFLYNCDKTAYELIKDTNAKLRQGSEMKPINLTCPHCQKLYEQRITLNSSDFFG
jgi:hypothetical protein